MADDLIYQNLKFERRWMRFERAMWLLMTAMLIAACFGVFGRGAYARTTTQSGPIEVKFDRVVRARSQSQLTVKLSESATQSGQVRMIVSGDLLGRARILEMHPEPSETTALDKAAALTFNVEPGKPATVTFVQQVQGFGRIQSHLGVDNGPAVAIDQIILP
jgi:hypothetical protein